MRPRFRFTLDGNKVITDPIGWEDIELILERDKDYHSLVEKIVVPLEFYGNNEFGDGGYEYMKEARRNGPDSQIELLVEVTFNDSTYEDFAEGVLDLTELVEIEHYRRFQCTFILDNLWAKFINRKSIPVDIRSTKDLYGNTRTPTPAQTLTLPSQEVRKKFYGEIDQNASYTIPDDQYGVIDFGLVTISEIDQKFDYPLIVSEQIPNYIFAVEEDGTYTISAVVLASIASLSPVVDINVLFQLNAFSSAVAFTKTNHATYSTFSYSASYFLRRGDTIRIYFQNANPGPNTIVFNKTIGGETSYLDVVGDTVFEETTAEGFYIHDVAFGIADRILDDTSVFYSEYFGASFTSSVAYGADGCGADYELFKGKNIRGYSLSDKPFSMSFDDWWDGVNPIFNLGLTSENGSIRVEQKEYFYDSSSNSVVLENVEEIEISYEKDALLTSIEIGYNQWEAESGSGIDDPQTKHTYSTRFKTIGNKISKDIKLLSDFMAASLAIEQTRREAIELGKDWKLDERTFIIQTDSSASPIAPRLYAAALITNLLNAETRYNARLTPASNFNRWKPFLANGFQNYSGDVFRFTSGEGNVTMTFNNPAATGCDAEAGTTATENGDIPIGTDFLFLPLVFKFTHPLTWIQYKAIRAYKYKSIGISWYDNEDVLQESTLFIRKLSFNINQSEAKFECYLKSNFISDEYTLTAEHGSFALTGQDAAMTVHRVMTAEQGSFTLTGQDATLTVLQEIDIQMELFENVVPSDTWISQFDNGTDPFEQLSVTNNGSTDSDALNAASSVDVAVSKTTALGIAEAAGAIIWYKSGVEQHRVTFNITDDVSLNTRTITSVGPTDVLKVDVYEGITPP